MKKLLLTLAICLGCMGILGAQDIWKPINGTGILGVGPDGSIFAYNEYGKLTRSQDEGETWQIVLGQETGFTGHINASCFAVSNEGRICVFNDNLQTVVYSDDNGDTWQQTPSISSCAMPDKTGICAPTNDIIVVWAEEGEIEFTLDGGETWDGSILEMDEESRVGDMIVNAEGDVYVSVCSYSDGDAAVFHSTLSDIENWELFAAEDINVKDMAFDPEGNVVACGWKTEGSVGFQHVPGFYLFDGTSLAISDGGVVYTPHFTGLQAVLSYSTDHGEHFIEIGEHLPLVDIAPGGENAHLFKGADNHLYFDGGGEYWKSIRDADQIQRSFPLENTAWVQFYRSMYEDSTYYQLGIKGDTLVNETTYKKVINCAHLGYPIEGECFGGIREDADGKCYFMSFVPAGIYAPWPLHYDCEVNTEYPLYDFSLSVCDVFQTIGLTPHVVFDTAAMELNGSMRKVLWFNVDCDDSHYYDYQWIEGIGSTHSLLYPIQDEPDNGPEYRLVEVWQDEELLYKNPHFEEDFPYDNTRWAIYYQNLYLDWAPYIQIGIKGDTVVEGTTYHKVIKCTSYGDVIDGDCFGGIRVEADGKWYFRLFSEENVPQYLYLDMEPNTERLIYDYSLSVCDGFEYEGQYWMSVFDIDEIGINGSMRNRFWFDSNCEEGDHPHDWNWIEGIGSNYGLLYAIQAFPLDGSAYHLGEVYQDGELIYSDPYFHDYVPMIKEGNQRQKWNVVYIGANENYPNDYFTEIQSIRDNITLDGVDYKLVWRESVHESKRNAGAVREEDKRVYFRRYWQQSYQEEVLLYDFNLSVGDTVSVGWSDYQLIVLEESQVQVNGTTRRQLGLAMYFADGTIGEIEEYWIEGVGSTYGFLNSGYEGWVGAFVYLLCYHENGNLVWDNEEFDDCVMNSNGAPATFAPQGAEWYFNVASFMASPTTYFHMEVLGDTLIRGHQCSVISPQYGGGNGDKQFVYEENGVVYWYNQTIQDFTTLYDFNAEVGDTWICDIDSCSFEIQVESVEEVTWEGHTYRVQLVLSENNEWGIMPFHGYIIEGIGYSRGLFPDPMACSSGIVCGPYPDYLRCYLVDGEMLYHEGEYDCDEYGSCWDGTIAEAYAGGDGTAENPYQIKTSKQLALLAQQTNDGTGGDAYYELLDNINLTNCLTGGMIPWVSIGTTAHAFTGHFNGNGHSINNLHQNITDGDAQPVGGLFGCTNGAEISNVHLAQCYVSGNGKYVGTLVGYAGLTNIYNCSIYDGRASTDKQYGVAGGLIGLAGYTYGEEGTSQQSYSIMACQVKEAVKVEASIVGGVVGQINELRAKAQYVMDGCSMCGMADGFCVQGGSSAGGVAGQLWYATMVRCSNNQKVVGGVSQGGGCIGGIVGRVGYAASVEECINNETGQISGTEGIGIVNAGGIVGAIHSGIENRSSDIIGCQNFADVSGTQCCGGIVGYYHLNHSSTPCFIRNCYNHSRVICHRPEKAGGIVGHVGQGSGNLCIVECGNLGDVVMESEEQGSAGGILGSREAGHVYIVNVFNRGSVSAPIYAGGIIGGGENIGDCTIQNVYNAGEVVTGEEIKGAIAYNQQETDHFSDCYWLGVLDNHAGVSQGEPLQHSCAFWPTTYFGEWSLDSLQFGHDLVQALNTGTEALVEQYPTVLAQVHRWEYDLDNTNDGYPIFGGIEVNYPFVGTEWYYEIEDENGNVTYQHLEYAADTTVNHKDVVIIIRTNTLYDKSGHTEMTREYVYEESGVIYWWNKDLEEFTPLYDFGAEAGDEWEIKVGMESITMHVDTVEYQEYEGCLYKMLIVSDENDLFSGTIVCGIGHLTSFFPERLMTRGKNYRVEGIRCYWRNGELVFKYGDRDCDEVYEEWHNGIEEDGPSTGSGAFTVYPNPTNGILVVETRRATSLQDQTYRITNLMGQTLMSGTITAEIQRIDVSNLPEGMYFISVGDTTWKFVVK